MQSNGPAAPEIGALIERLDTAYSKGELTAADRIIEFPNLLRALKQVYTQDVIEGRKRHQRIYSLLDDLLEIMKPYKTNLFDPNAPTSYRPRSQKEFVDIIDSLKFEMRKMRRNEDANDA